MARHERSHVEFADATWMSFDRYARYGAIARAVRATVGGDCRTVLDVGDASGYLQVFAPEWTTVSVDLRPPPDALPGARRIAGDGARLPMADGAVDVVVSSDALEHVPPPARAAFIGELARVAREAVVLAAPFDTPGVAGAEELARRYALLATGRPQEQLDEHAANGLPSVDETVAVFASLGLAAAARGNGNLSDWLVLMLLKHQLEARPALLPLDAGFDAAYNLLLAARNEVPPFYRQVIVASRTRTPAFGAPLGPIDGLGDPTPLLAALLTATATEVNRQDTLPQLHGLKYEIDQISQRTLALESTQQQVLDRIVDLTHKINKVVDLVRHPVKTLGRRRT
jgi:hypothetical protein